MRSPNDLCLLCDKNLAIKKNSHIVPAFMTKSLLTIGNEQRAYRVSSDSMHCKPKFSQDSDKESYILCPECESYFTILETFFCNNLHYKIREIQFKDEFINIRVSDDGLCKISLNSNPVIFRLFLYSVIWRCSISNSETFHRFNLKIDEEEILKSCLKEFICSKKSELFEKISISKKNIPNFPFVLITAEGFIDSTRHFVFCETGKWNPYQFYLNEYILVFSFFNYEGHKPFMLLNNFDVDEPLKVGVYPLSFWNARIDAVNEKFTKKVIENLSISGRKPYKIYR